MRRSAAIAGALVLGLLVGALLVAGLGFKSFFGGSDPESVASASLKSLQEQSRLTPLTARFVAVVTSTQSRLGISAKKTLIMPGTVRYEVDLAKLRQRDLKWDESARKLTVTLPPIELAGPEIDLNQLREYDDGGLAIALTGGEGRIDAANRSRGQQELLRQAREPTTMRLARDAAKRAVERSFAMPLKAAGVDATVAVRFPEEGTNDPSFLDRSRRPEDVLREQAEKRRAGGG